jgi:hypothetical protein
MPNGGYMQKRPAVKGTTIVKPEPISSRIEKAAWAGLERRIEGIPLEPMYCLKFARRVVETALGLGDRGFYRLVQGVDANPSAKELEALLRQQKPSWLQRTAQAGDLVFWQNEPPAYGHVGVAVSWRGTIWIAQNTTIATLGVDYPGALRLVRLRDHNPPSTIIRIGG